MSDKLKQSVSVVPTYVAGENLVAGKLNVQSLQLRESTKRLEKAIGDIHDESYPYSATNPERLTSAWGRDYSDGTALTGTSTLTLNIANLARLIGPASAINPRVLSIAPTQITETVPSGVYEFTLRYPPYIVSVSFPVAFSDGTVFASRVLTINSLNATGEYYINETNGTIYTASETAGGTITYYVRPLEMGGISSYPTGTFNVIPDPNQIEADGTGCTINPTPDDDGRYTVTLPTISHQQSNVDLDSIALTAEDINFQMQLLLPEVLVSNYSAGDVIPSGFLLLKNWTTGEVYDGAVYYYNSSSTFKIGSIDLEESIDNEDVFVAITVGTNITMAIDDLRVKFSAHNHDRRFGEPAIDIDSIVGWTAQESESGRFIRSETVNNFAPQYLHRDGWVEGVDETYNDQNIMRGHLVLGYEDSASGEYLDNTPERQTYSLYLGNPESGVRLYRDENEETYLILKPDAGGILHLNTPNNATIATTGDLTLDSNSGDVQIEAAENIVMACLGDIELTPVGSTSSVTLGGSSLIHALAVGDSNVGDELDPWEIDKLRSSSNDYDTPGSAWVFPKFYVIHRAYTATAFNGYTNRDNQVTDPADWAEINFWQKTVSLPNLSDSYDTANNIIGAMVMARPSGTTEWYSVGDASNEAVYDSADGAVVTSGTWNAQELITYTINDHNHSSNANQMIVRIPALGYTGGNAFVKSSGEGAAIDIDLKITLFVAAPGVQIT